jgi:hypothetical protein
MLSQSPVFGFKISWQLLLLCTLGDVENERNSLFLNVCSFLFYVGFDVSLAPSWRFIDLSYLVCLSIPNASHVAPTSDLTPLPKFPTTLTAIALPNHPHHNHPQHHPPLNINLMKDINSPTPINTNHTPIRLPEHHHIHDPIHMHLQ